MSSAAEKANLARIRDNQRRSRARRKEYLQELEARLHQCELQGIEASAEIQQAARRVADENRKLRVLLSRHGVGEETVDAYLQSSNPDSVSMLGNDAVVGFGAGQGPAGMVLEQLLNTKRHISADTGASGQRRGGTVGSRDSSVASIGTHSGSRWDTFSHGSTSQQGPFLTPNSSVGRSSQSQRNSGTLMTSQPQQQVCGGSGYDFNAFGGYTNQQQQQQQHHFQQAAPQGHSRNQNRKLEEVQTTPLHLTAKSPSQNPQYVSVCSNSAASNPPTSRAIGTNNCVFATDMISTLTGGDPRDVRADLGCDEYYQDGECEVDNQVVFGVLDQYTGSGDGMGI